MLPDIWRSLVQQEPRKLHRSSRIAFGEVQCCRYSLTPVRTEQGGVQHQFTGAVLGQRGKVRKPYWAGRAREI